MEVKFFSGIVVSYITSGPKATVSESRAKYVEERSPKVINMMDKIYKEMKEKKEQV